jgi:hypothetical protein
VFKIAKSDYTVAVSKDLTTPYLEGITIGGELKVIYSPLDFEAGWQGCDHALCKGYQAHSAIQLGINIVMYAVTH